MKKIRMGVICPSEIAFRRFMPALLSNQEFEYAGIAYASEIEWFGSESKENKNKCDILEKEKVKAERFLTTYGGHVFESYEQLLEAPDIDAIYLPLPPALHFKWGKAVLEHGKHLFMEKPFTTCFADTNDLLKLADSKDLAVHENYMFQYHSQLNWIQRAVTDGKIGELRLVRIAFGFPFRGATDFRYIKALGGGALLDCGGYTVKLASLFLGESAQLITSHLNTKADFEVDLYGSATLINDMGLTAQLSFGMDNSYKCELELWGSTGVIFTNRILTAPEEFEPSVTIKTAEGEQTYTLPPDDSFFKSIQMFGKYLQQPELRLEHNCKIRQQAELVDIFQKGATI